LYPEELPGAHDLVSVGAPPTKAEEDSLISNSLTQQSTISNQQLTILTKTVACPPTGHFLSTIGVGNAANPFYGLSGDSPWCQVTGRGDGEL
jgi:hypothetical protein